MSLDGLCHSCFEPHEGADACTRCGWGGESASAKGELRIGSVLRDDYVIGRVLGRGGFGITYLAWDQRLRRKRAIKEYFPNGVLMRDGNETTAVVVSGQYDIYADGLAKYLAEARLLAQFEDHPTIVSPLTFFEANDTAYLVMEYLEGETLRDYVERLAPETGAGIPYEWALHFLRPILEALVTIHEHSILHRDVSPENILLTTDGQAKLLDFGAARQQVADATVNFTTILRHHYAPPEQYTPNGEQGPWTDLYAFGATFYRAITGASPPPAMDRVVHGEVLVAPSEIGADVPEAVEAALLQCLELKPADRPQSAAALLGPLTGVMDAPGEPHAPAPVESAGESRLRAGAAALSEAAAESLQVAARAVPKAAAGIGQAARDLGRRVRDFVFELPVPPPGVAIAVLAVLVASIAAGAWWLARPDSAPPAANAPEPILLPAVAAAPEPLEVAFEAPPPPQVTPVEREEAAPEETTLLALAEPVEEAPFEAEAAAVEAPLVEAEPVEVAADPLVEDPPPAIEVFEPPATADGSLVVRSNVSGDRVLIDGVAVGPSGRQPHALTPGEYRVRVEKSGRIPYETTVRVRAGKSRVVRAVLPPERGVPRPNELAALTQAADRGHTQSQSGLARLYARGFGVPQDDALAQQWYERAARAGDAEAQYALATWLEYGTWTAGPSYDPGRKGLMGLFGRRDMRTTFERAIYREKPRDAGHSATDAFHWYQQAARAGHARSQERLGAMYASGRGVPQNTYEAFEWFTQAANKGLPHAQYAAGMMLVLGEARKLTPANHTRGLDLLRKSADQGHELAIEALEEI